MIRFDIDLSIEQQGDDGFGATVTAVGTEIVVTVDDASRLPMGGRRTLHDLGPFADDLARQGVSVRVDGPDGTLVALGDVGANVLQRLVSGSQHVRVGSPTALARVRRGARSSATIPLPPTTMLPIAPTLGRRIRRRPTTTHASPGAGRPRLVFAVGTGSWDDAVPYEFDLLPERTRIGSGADVDLRLPGLEPLHAEVVHRGDDEYVLVAHGPIGGGAASRDGEAAPRVLRTGARIELGAWRLAYVREEWADHGRPYGGRQGGELAIQRPQPPRHVARPEVDPGP